MAKGKGKKSSVSRSHSTEKPAKHKATKKKYMREGTPGFKQVQAPPSDIPKTPLFNSYSTNGQNIILNKIVKSVPDMDGFNGMGHTLDKKTFFINLKDDIARQKVFNELKNNNFNAELDNHFSSGSKSFIAIVVHTKEYSTESSTKAVTRESQSSFALKMEPLTDAPSAAAMAPVLRVPVSHDTIEAMRNANIFSSGTTLNSSSQDSINNKPGNYGLSPEQLSSIYREFQRGKEVRLVEK